MQVEGEVMREHPVTLTEFKSPDPDESHFSSELTYRMARCWQSQGCRENGDPHTDP